MEAGRPGSHNVGKFDGGMVLAALADGECRLVASSSAEFVSPPVSPLVSRALLRRHAPLLRLRCLGF